jgi:hypothetical protein
MLSVDFMLFLCNVMWAFNVSQLLSYWHCFTFGKIPRSSYVGYLYHVFVCCSHKKFHRNCCLSSPLAWEFAIFHYQIHQWHNETKLFHKTGGLTIYSWTLQEYVTNCTWFCYTVLLKFLPWLLGTLLPATMNTSPFLSTCVFGMELVAALSTMTAPSNHYQRMCLIHHFEKFPTDVWGCLFEQFLFIRI